MNLNARRTVILVNKGLPTGLAVNAAAIAAAMITTALPALMGPPVKTADAELPGVVLAPLPVLVTSSEELLRTWERCRADGGEVEAFPFTSLAQSCRTYDEYVTKMAAAEMGELELSSLGLCGPKRLVNALCGSLPLYPGR